MLDFKRKVSPVVSLGVLMGAFFTTGLLFFLNKTEERLQESYYVVVYPEDFIELPR